VHSTPVADPMPFEKTTDQSSQSQFVFNTNLSIANHPIRLAQGVLSMFLICSHGAGILRRS
jgi:hypothetical protein